MNTTFYDLNNDKIISGITLKDSLQPETNNMALHTSKNPEAIIQNRQRLAKELNSTLEQFVCAVQTHSDHVHQVTTEDTGRGSKTMGDAIPDTDALYTKETGIVLCTFTADCVPVTFYDDKHQIIGVIHSGWQGTVKEITIKTLKRIIEQEHIKPETLHVHLGPALSQEKFEVDRDVYEKYQKLGYADPFMYYQTTTGKYHIDNQQTVKKQCELIGVPAAQITYDPICTFKSPLHFSYREDKQAGRHLTFISKID